MSAVIKSQLNRCPPIHKHIGLKPYVRMGPSTAVRVPLEHVFPRRRNHTPLSARVTQKQASRDSVANEEKLARAANAQGHY